jgi:hypothetical protein
VLGPYQEQNRCSACMQVAVWCVPFAVCHVPCVSCALCPSCHEHMLHTPRSGLVSAAMKMTDALRGPQFVVSRPALQVLYFGAVCLSEGVPHQGQVIHRKWQNIMYYLYYIILCINTNNIYLFTTSTTSVRDTIKPSRTHSHTRTHAHTSAPALDTPACRPRLPAYVTGRATGWAGVPHTTRRGGRTGQ